MKMRVALLPMALIGVIGLVGCGKPEEDSCNIRTPGIFVEYEVHESGGSAQATATFWVGDKPGGTFLSLGACGDNVSVNGQPMSKQSNVDHDYYQATLSDTDAYEFVFTRDGEDPYSSSVSPRAAVTITAPAQGELSRAAAFDVTWDANDSGNLELLIKGQCIKDYPEINGSNIPDTGSYSVAAGAIEPFVSSDADKSCTAELSLTRENSGTLSSSLKGTIQGFSSASTSFTSKP